MEEKRVTLVGIGNCGNQVVNLGEKKYPELFDCVYINTSNSDLSMVTTEEDSLKFKVGESEEFDVEGSGKDRSAMKNYLKGDIEALLTNEQFRDIVDKPYVFVIGATAGGTGSGAVPVLSNCLQKAFPDSNIIPVGVLPREDASLLELTNTYDFLNELYNVMSPSTTYMLYDNSTRTDIPAITAALTDVNENIIEDLRVITGVDNYPTPYESIDAADMEMIVSTPGRLMVGRVPANLLTEKFMEDGKLDEIVVDCIKKSANAETDRDGTVVRWGTITYLTDAVNKLYSPKLPKLEKFIGVPIETFNHNAINPNQDKLNFMHIVMSGLSPINDRKKKIDNRIVELNEIKAQQESRNAGIEQNEQVANIVNGIRKGRNGDDGKDEKFTIANEFDKFF